MNEKRWDELLGINTIGRDDSKADDNHHPFEMIQKRMIIITLMNQRLIQCWSVWRRADILARKMS